MGKYTQENRNISISVSDLGDDDLLLAQIKDKMSHFPLNIPGLPNDVPQQKVVSPPPGLATRGIAMTIFLCAMAKGGKKNFEDRYRDYFNTGIEVAQGINTWDKGTVVKNAEGTRKNDWEGRPGFGRSY